MRKGVKNKKFQIIYYPKTNLNSYNVVKLQSVFK